MEERKDLDPLYTPPPTSCAMRDRVELDKLEANMTTTNNCGWRVLNLTGVYYDLNNASEQAEVSDAPAD